MSQARSEGNFGVFEELWVSGEINPTEGGSQPSERCPLQTKRFVPYHQVVEK